MRKFIYCLFVAMLVTQNALAEKTSKPDSEKDKLTEYMAQFSSDEYDCQKALVSVTYPMVGLSKKDWTIFNLSDLLEYILGAQETGFGKAINLSLGQTKPSFESYLIGRDVNEDIEALYFLAKRKEVRKIIMEDEKSLEGVIKDKFNTALKTDAKKRLEEKIKASEGQPLSNDIYQKYNYPVNPASANREAIVQSLENEISEKLALMFICPPKLALNNAPTELTGEVHKYRERLRRKLEAKHLNDFQKAVDDVKRMGEY